MIPAEAVEAAGRGLARHKWPTAIGVWESFGQGMQDDFRDQARAALEAAAPYIRAQALEDAAQAGADPSPEDMDTYFIDQADVGRWLSARAAAERGGE